MTSQTQIVIDRLEAMSKQGESYDGKGRHGWRNPVRADTGPLLHALALLKNPQTILEIGTAYGLSGCYLASALGPDSMLTTIEWDEQVAREARANFAEAALPVHVIAGDAVQALQGLKFKFDLVFLDANKDGYFEQCQILRENNLLNPGAWLLADNVIDRASEMGNFLDWVKQFPHTIIPTECGLLVARL